MHHTAYFEKAVHAAHLFHIPPVHAVQPKHLFTAVFMRLLLPGQAGRIVAAAFGKTGEPRCSAHILILHINTHRGKAVFVIGPRGRCNNKKLVSAAGLYAKACLCGNGKRPQVKAGARGSGHPICL